jgi:hypothetical protein
MQWTGAPLVERFFFGLLVSEALSSRRGGTSTSSQASAATLRGRHFARDCGGLGSGSFRT